MQFWVLKGGNPVTALLDMHSLISLQCRYSAFVWAEQWTLYANNEVYFVNADFM